MTRIVELGGILVRDSFADLGQLRAGSGGRGADFFNGLSQTLKLALALFKVSAQAQGKLNITAVVHRQASSWEGCSHARARTRRALFGLPEIH